MKIYNSISRQKDEFVPVTPGHVGMYVCGPTVYGPPHLGHARSYINFDVVRRTFTELGYKVKYVQNITDVGHIVGDIDDGEDKIIRQAKLEELDPYEIAYKYECDYFDKMDKLGVLRPSISCRATGFIPDIIEMIQKLINTGHAYVTKEGNVYFSVRSYPGYGKLSRRKLDENVSGERIEIAGDKREPHDFALWKKATGGHIMRWDSPWGKGYPGWHIECSVMSRKFLGDTFDIHGGGLDNMFPHHDCEFAQSECANGVPFVHYFMHNNLVTVNGTKMGKSLGNSITLEKLFDDFGAEVIRYFIVSVHYRSPLDFSEKAIAAAASQLEKLKNQGTAIYKLASGKTVKPKVGSEAAKMLEGFMDAMQEDFNAPLAISVILPILKVNVAGLSAVQAQELLFVLKTFERVLGVCVANEDLGGQSAVSAQLEAENQALKNVISSVRADLRAQKNYELSDKIRDMLTHEGIVVSDKKL